MEPNCQKRSQRVRRVQTGLTRAIRMESRQDSHPNLSHDLHKAVIMGTVGSWTHVDPMLCLRETSAELIASRAHRPLRPAT